jgi:hypothetical protein
MAENKDAVKTTDTVTNDKDTKKVEKAPKQKSDKELKAEKLKKMLEGRTDFEAKLIKSIVKGRFGLVDKSLLNKDKEVIFTTMRIIGELRVDKYVDPIAQVVCDAADPAFRKTAAESLGLMKNTRALFQLIKRMEIEKDPAVLAAIKDAIRAIHNKEAEAE